VEVPWPDLGSHHGLHDFDHIVLQRIIQHIDAPAHLRLTVATQQHEFVRVVGRAFFGECFKRQAVNRG
jgi:hypothetical protein